MTDQKSSNLPWILGGCGALLVFGCCLTSAGGAFYYRMTGTRAAEARDAARQAEEMRRAYEEAARDGTGPALPIAGTPSLTVMANVTRVSGRRLTVRAGEPCVFTVTYPARGNDPTDRWCNANVRCGGVSIYGGGTGGFFPCTFTQSPALVRGSDSETTNGDRDGAFSIDTMAGTMSVRDDSAGDYGTFELDATITRAM